LVAAPGGYDPGKEDFGLRKGEEEIPTEITRMTSKGK
jgi:hypothetical protein